MRKNPDGLFLFSLFAILVLVSGPAAFGKKSPPKKLDGAKLFAQHCASCHQGGGNLIKPKREIAGSKKLENILTFKTYLSAPPGHMPYYHNIVSNKEALSSLYQYCKNTFKEKGQTQSLLMTADKVAIDPGQFEKFQDRD